MSAMYTFAHLRRFTAFARLAARSSSILLFFAITICSVVGACRAAAPDPLALGRQYTSWFYTGETDRLWQLFSPEMKKVFGTVDGLKRFRAMIIRDWGHETKVLTEQTQSFGFRVNIYERIGSFSVAPSPVRIEWAVESDGTVTGFFVKLASEKVPAGFLDDQPKVPLLGRP